MELITPAIGQIFWGGLVFLILLFLLKKFAWKPMLSAVNQREESIQESIDLAEKTKAEMEALKLQNEDLLKEARIERDKMIKDATATSKKLIEDARVEGQTQQTKIVEEAQKIIRSEKAAAIAELKTQVASLSLEIAEKVIKGELASDDKQKALAEQIANDISLN
ncbi:F0F1 ATP synthase subunit B [Crocinitomix catalasitica]|uniref:F0F1 ATP synthase subunit B n=1 Tax=Crocinitomix catalasitica TaxID=184607 RepID=UPI0004844226|nr:F0F1 ATP synthase subunit B [Crocinitomix catalasitica]